VLVETLRRAHEAGASVSLLDPWYDVDTPEDLRVLRSHLTALDLAGDTIFCPRTWEFLHRLPPET
jgi:choline kinase